MAARLAGACHAMARPLASLACIIGTIAPSRRRGLVAIDDRP